MNSPWDLDSRNRLRVVGGGSVIGGRKKITSDETCLSEAGLDYNGIQILKLSIDYTFQNVLNWNINKDNS